jgi:MFS family permease
VLGTIVGGMLIGSDDNYQMLFWVMGLFVIASGVLSLIFLKDAPHVTPHKEGSFWQQFSQVFRFKDMLKQRELLMACLTSTVFFIAFNIYFTHMGNWLIYRMGFDASSMGLIEGIGLLLASLLVIPGIKLINNNKTPLLAAISIVLNFVGVVYIFFTVHPNTVNPAKLFSLPNLPLFIGVFLAGAGYILITQSLTMWVKELYPEEAKGQFEGIRIAFFALLPMFGGTILANIIVKNGSGTFVNDYGITENIPTESIYGWAAVIVLFAFIPLFIGAKDYWKRKKADSE